MVLFLTLAATAAPCTAYANLRAPRVEARQPSSAVRPLGEVPDVTVLGETLDFRCDNEACDVEARYRISAAHAVTIKSAFVVPTATPVHVLVGASPALAEVLAAPPEAISNDYVDGQEANSIQRQNLPMLEARFEASFAAGDNTIIVTYRQPLGRYEHDYGYFKKGRFVQSFRYELWPLSEWKHAPGFQVDGTVTIRRPPPSWWKRTFSKVRSLGCGTGKVSEATKLEQRGDDLRITFQIHDPLPHRLWCEIGDEDLVPKP